MPEQTTDVNIDDLSAAIIDGATRSFDCTTGWESWEVAFERTDEEINMSEHEPMINTLWPLPDGFEVPDDVRDRLDNMTVVNVRAEALHTDRGLWLALTGGGMDMSWPIARTYVNLGYLPPATLGDLPAMGGMDFNEPGNLRVIEALKQSHSHMADRRHGNMADLDRLKEGE